MRRSRLTALAAVLTLALTSAAAAQDEAARATAREQFALGVSRYEAADYTAALAAFQEAYRLAPHPMVRVNMANCYEHLGRPIEALHHFERFLAEAQGVARQQRREVETAMRRLQGRVGEVRMAIAPDGALVTIDSSETRRAPILEPVRLAEGTHHVEVRMDGYRTERREVQVAGGQATRIDVQLERGSGDQPAVARSEPPRTTAPAEGAGATPGQPTGEPDDAEPAEVDGPVEGGDGGFTLRLTLPVLIGAGATAAFTFSAIISGVVALSANGDFENAVVRSNDPLLTQSAQDQAYSEGLAAASTADAASIAADVFWIGTIAAAGVTAFFVFVDGMDGESEPSADAGAPSVTLAPGVGPSGGGVTLVGSF